MSKRIPLSLRLLYAGLAGVLLTAFTGCPCENPTCNAPSSSEQQAQPAPAAPDATPAPQPAEPKAGDVVTIIGNDQFIKFIEETPVAVIDFSATWCGPCQRFIPDLEKVAADNKEKGVKVGSVDVDRNRELASQFKVQGIPDIRIFVRGKQVGTVVGYNPPELFKNVDAAIAQLKDAKPADAPKPDAKPADAPKPEAKKS